MEVTRVNKSSRFFQYFHVLTQRKHFRNLSVIFGFYNKSIEFIKMHTPGNDLFQIAQMQDIYFTLRMWAILSPNGAYAASKAKRESIKENQRKCSKRTKPK